ncbi:cyclopropane-fatty-acyl-phospholipid synthase [Sphingobium sp. 22B]|uniref:SAM-dependent methyltransferase n=1 Tax=unclassified Sphingobium TaxID=2611147 RepID=UPI0007847577|nr:MULTISPECIES: cyclopropane-fatty-acyl-phospholipid synthase family protein [unclassified Sphingobium]KXU31330.1 cyclopropane-fatty-acyl-phospholipid synthase [Sphingobium sp. AM]KYC31377.1 cyclopropane-fatty-acyl-phospholipid synthase [Sphingobium sp. 22B]OAP31259.1 cyclopropane-fatty-acyl-phospholipid synthase [Sphingobium sp. 20006FA]
MKLFDRVIKRLVTRGQLSIYYHDGRKITVGTPEPGFPSLALKFHDARVPFDIVRDPRLGMAEAFIDGRVAIEGGGIMELISLIRMNNAWETGKSISDLGSVKRGFKAIRRKLWAANHRARAKANVAHHYDLSGALYALFLDRDRQYSCAYFPDADNEAGISLEQAQEDKKAHIAAKLHLKPGMKVLDIGCGWGGMALYLHRTCGVDVTGITLSEEQLKVARQRAQDAGVADHVRFELIDYRDMDGSFDRIVSVGMFEHVGTKDYRTFYTKCRELLTPEGVMLIHTIGRVDGPGITDAFTQKYIFPGGYIPALSEMIQGSEGTRLMVTDVEVLRIHYGLTIREWYKRTLAHKADIVALYDERFFRLWTFYLAGAATVFEHGGMVNYQVQYVRDRRSLPITRDYMLEAESALRGR